MPKGGYKMRAKFKTAVTHDIEPINIPVDHLDYLLAIFDSKMKDAASVGACCAIFSTDTMEIAKIWGVTGYKLEIESFTKKNLRLWKGIFTSTKDATIRLQVLGSLE